MMEVERREEPKRMHIEKRVALYVPGKKKAYPGVTRNMSDAGICAGFKKLPKDGEDVMLHVYWHDDKPPIEQPANLVWSSPTMPDGIIRVGLMLKDEPAGRTDDSPPDRDSPAPVKAPSTAAVSTAAGPSIEAVKTTPPKPVIEQGAEVRLLVGGVAIETVAASIGDIQEDNSVQVVLEIVDPAFGVDANLHPMGEDAPEDQDWTPHPFRDTWHTVRKILGPATAVLLRSTRTALHLAAEFALPLIRKIRTRKKKLPAA